MPDICPLTGRPSRFVTLAMVCSSASDTDVGAAHDQRADATAVGRHVAESSYRGVVDGDGAAALGDDPTIWPTACRTTGTARQQAPMSTLTAQRKSPKRHEHKPRAHLLRIKLLYSQGLHPL